MKTENFAIRPATAADVPIILELIRALATYERAPNDVTATADGLSKVLFGEKPAARAVQRLRAARLGLAAVVDQKRNLIGVVTSEDLIARLVRA